MYIHLVSGEKNGLEIRLLIRLRLRTRLEFDFVVDSGNRPLTGIG